MTTIVNMPSDDEDIQPFRNPAPMEVASRELTVVIVNYESGDYLRACLGSMEAAIEGIDAEVIVVDNGSTDDSIAGLAPDERTRVVRSGRNLGYGGACNLAAEMSQGSLLCFLNPDTILQPGSLTSIVKAERTLDRAGVIGPKILNSDLTLQPSCRVVPDWKVAIGHALLGTIRPGNRFSRAYLMQDRDRDRVLEVDWVSGAAMVARREAFEAVGGFDGRFFMYVEDLDLCDRIRRAGWKVYYFPGAQVVHHIAGSSRRAPYKMIWHHHRSALRFTLIRSSGTWRVLIIPFLALGLGLRMVLSWVEYYLRNRRDLKGTGTHGH